MVSTAVWLFAIFTLFKLVISVKEVLFIKNVLKEEAVILSKEDYKTAGLYSMEKHFVSMYEAIFSLILVVFWLAGGIFGLNEAFKTQGFSENVTGLLILLIFMLVNYLFTLPTDIYARIIDKRYGFNTSSWKLFIVDQIKKGILFFTLMSGVLYLLILFINSLESWWLIGFAFIFSVVVVLNLLMPYFMSWFNTFTPLEDAELKGSIERMFEKVGFHSNGVFVMDASKRDSRLNAFFGGLGKSKRVVLFDTLIEKLSKNEILSVLGHELGHFKHHDLLKSIAVMGVIFFSLFFLIAHIPVSFYNELRVDNSAQNIIILLILFSDILFFIFLPIFNIVSRHNEFEADQAGAALGSKEDLTSALKELVNENKSFPKNSKLYSVLYHSHPPILERLEELK